MRKNNIEGVASPYAYFDLQCIKKSRNGLHVRMNINRSLNQLLKKRNSLKNDTSDYIRKPFTLNNFENSIIGKVHRESSLTTYEFNNTLAKSYKCISKVKKKVKKFKPLVYNRLPNTIKTIKNEKVDENLTIHYASENTLNTLKEIIRRKHIISLKKFTKEYEEYSTSLIKPKGDTKSKFKASFMNTNCDYKEAKNHKIDYPLSVLRNDYKSKEMSRRKNLRMKNLHNIYKNVLLNIDYPTIKFLQRNSLSEIKGMERVIKSNVLSKKNINGS